MRNLLGRLLDRSPQSLSAIARFWEVDLRGRDLHQDVGHLYREMTDPWSFAVVWQRLPAPDRAAVRVLVAEEEPLAAAEIAAHRSVTVEAATAALRELYRGGFVYQEPGDPETGAAEPDRFFVPRELAYLSNRADVECRQALPVDATAAALVDRLDDLDLTEIAEHLGYRVVPTVALRPDLVAYVTPRLGDPDVVRDQVRALDPTSARLWTWLVERGGVADPAEAREALAMPAPEFRQAVRTLGGRGLLWRGYTRDHDHQLRFVVPEIVRHPRRRPPSPPPDLVVVTAGEVEEVEWVPPVAIAWDLLTLLRLAAADANWRPPRGDDAPSLRRLAPRLWLRGGDVPPRGYVDFLAYLGAGLGLLTPGQGGVAVEPLREWTRLEFAEQQRRLVGLWRQAAEWTEGAGREILQIWGADWPGFRTRLVAALDALSPGEWVTLESLADRFAATEPAALGTQYTAAASHEPGDESPEARRRAVVRLAAEATLSTAGVWLGLVDLSHARRRAPVLRPREDGRWLLAEGREPPPEAALGAHGLAVQPDFSVLLLRPTPRRVWALTAFTDLERLDRVSVYRLTRESVARGLGTGLSVERMTGFLEQHGGVPLPQSVAYRVAEWAREYRRVRLHRAVLLEPDDPAGLDELWRALREAGLRVERLGPERLLVFPGPDDAADRIDEVLRARDQTPHWSGGAP